MFFVFYIFNKEWWKSCQFFILFFCWLFSTKGLSLSALKSQQEVIVNLHLGFWFPLTSGWVYRTENETCLLWDITDIVNNNLLLTMKGFTCFFGKVTEQRLGREKLVGGGRAENSDWRSPALCSGCCENRPISGVWSLWLRGVGGLMLLVKYGSEIKKILLF